MALYHGGAVTVYLLAGALELSPNQAMVAIRDVVKGFQMPGTDIPGFQRKAVEMAVAGIYDLRIHHDDVLVPVLRFWNIFERGDFGPVGERAREELIGFLGMLDERARFYEEKRKLAAVAG